MHMDEPSVHLWAVHLLAGRIEELTQAVRYLGELMRFDVGDTCAPMPPWSRRQTKPASQQDPFTEALANRFLRTKGAPCAQAESRGTVKQDTEAEANETRQWW